MSRWRFYFDEHVPEPIATGLRRLNVDVLTTHEGGNKELPDEDQLAYAHEHGLVFFTHDEGVLSIAARWAAEGRGAFRFGLLSSVAPLHWRTYSAVESSHGKARTGTVEGSRSFPLNGLGQDCLVADRDVTLSVPVFVAM